MAKGSRAVVAALMAGAFLAGAEAAAADGPIVITQATAMAGNVTPGDAAGFPVLITRPGTYELGSNLLPTVGKSGIAISAHNVKIDMKGFSLNGQDAALHGIVVNGIPGRSVTVEDGSITGFRGSGVYASRLTVGRFDRLHVHWNRGTGINGGNYIAISDSIVAANMDDGVRCVNFCRITDNIISENLGRGIYIADGVVLGNVIERNSGLGIEAFSATGAGNNSIMNNNKLSKQTVNIRQMQPNACDPDCLE